MQLVNATAVVLAMQRSPAVSPFTVGELAILAELTARQTSNAIDSLLARGLVESKRRGVWQLTIAGRGVTAHVGVLKERAAAPITATTGVSAAKRAEGATGLRAAAWRALRIRRSATANEVCSLIDDGSYGDNVRDRILTYFGALQRFEVIGSKKARPGASERLYIVLNDLGMLAPMVSSRGRLYDPNKGEFLPPAKKGDAA